MTLFRRVIVDILRTTQVLKKFHRCTVLLVNTHSFLQETHRGTFALQRKNSKGLNRPDPGSQSILVRKAESYFPTVSGLAVHPLEKVGAAEVVMEPVVGSHLSSGFFQLTHGVIRFVLLKEPVGASNMILGRYLLAFIVFGWFFGICGR